MMDRLWAVWANTDDTEGRGRQYVLHVCETEATARRLAKGRYVQGSDCPIEAFDPIPIGDRKFAVPVEMVNIQRQTKEDTEVQKRLDAMRDAIAKAHAAGLSDDDVMALRGH